MSLSIIVVTVQNRDVLEDVYGGDAYRDLAAQVAESIRNSVGRAPRESCELPGSFLLVFPGMNSEAASALAWHVDRKLPREFGHDGLLMPVDVQVMVETHDGKHRTIERIGATTRASEVVAA